MKRDAFGRYVSRWLAAALVCGLWACGMDGPSVGSVSTDRVDQPDLPTAAFADASRRLNMTTPVAWRLDAAHGMSAPSVATLDPASSPPVVDAPATIEPVPRNGKTKAPPDDESPPVAHALAHACSHTADEWGATCGSEQKAACFLEVHFDLLFPDGIRLGHGKPFVLTSAAAVEGALPGEAVAGPIESATTDPDAADANALATELVALRINIRVDEAREHNGISFAALRMREGAFMGWSAAEIADHAEHLLSPPVGHEGVEVNLVDFHKLVEALVALNAAAIDCELAEYVSP